MQVTTLSTQLGLGSELVDWYRDATSVPFGHLLIDLSPRTMNTQILSTLQVFQSLFRKSESHFPQSCPKEFIPVSMRIHSKSTQRKLANYEKTSRGKVSRRSLTTITKKNNLEAKKKRSVVRKRIATNSSHYTSRQ